MRVLFAMLLLVGFAVGAAEPTQTFTDDLNRKVVNAGTSETDRLVTRSGYHHSTD